METNIGKKIKARRNELGWSLQDLADKMGYSSKATIVRVEKGEVGVTQTKAKKYAEVLGVSIAYLMDWEQANDNLSDVTVRLLVDKDFAMLVNEIHRLDGLQLLQVRRYVNQISR